MKKILAAVISLALASGLSACSASATSASGSDSTGAASDSASTSITRTVTDMSGDQVTVDGEVKSVVNLWPAGTSTFFVMGAGDLLSGLSVNGSGTVNSWTKLFYPEADSIPALGGVTPSVEEIIKLDPDLVIVHPSSVSSGYAQDIRDAGIPAININFSTYETMQTSYKMLGEVLGGEYQEKLNTWCDMVAKKHDEVEKLTANIAESDRPVVYYIGGQSDSLITTMGSGSICADWTKIAGGTYATDLLDESNTTSVTAEEIFKIDPDIIIVGGTWQHQILDELQSEDGWKELKAVKNGRVYTNPYGSFAWDRFGLESYLQMDYALMCIQPDIAAKAGINRDSIIKEVVRFYQLMNGTTLTEQQVGYMLDGLEPDGTQVAPSSEQSGGSGQGQRQAQGQSKAA